MTTINLPNLLSTFKNPPPRRNTFLRSPLIASIGPVDPRRRILIITMSIVHLFPYCSACCTIGVNGHGLASSRPIPIWAAASVSGTASSDEMLFFGEGAIVTARKSVQNFRKTFETETGTWTEKVKTNRSEWKIRLWKKFTTIEPVPAIKSKKVSTLSLKIIVN